MAREYPVACSSCGAEVFAPFVPTPGRILECPSCLITHNNMAKSRYAVNLVAFLTGKLGGAVNMLRAEGKKYNVLMSSKSGEPEVIATIEWVPKDSERICMPDIAIANIKPKDPAIKGFIKEFISKFGVEADIPNAPIQEL